MSDELVASDVTSEPSATEQANGAENVAPSKKKYSVKVDDIVEDLELDDAEVLSHISKGRGADKRFREAATLQSQVSEFLYGMKKDPIPALQRMGIDIKTLAKQAGISARDLHDNPREFAEQILLEALEEETMSPEAKRLRDLEKKFEDLNKPKQEQKQDEKKVDPKELQAAQAQAADEIQSQVVDAIKASGLDPSPALVLQIVNEMIAEIDTVGNVPDVHKTLSRSIQRSQRDAISLLSSVKDDAELLKYFPAPLQARLRRAFVDSVRTGQPRQVTNAEKPQKNVRKYRTLNEILDD